MWPSPQPRADPPSALAVTRFPAGSLPRPPTVTEEAEQANKLRREERRPSSCPRHHHGRHFAKGLAPWGEGVCRSGPRHSDGAQIAPEKRRTPAAPHEGGGRAEGPDPKAGGATRRPARAGGHPHPRRKGEIVSLRPQTRGHPEGSTAEAARGSWGHRGAPSSACNATRERGGSLGHPPPLPPAGLPPASRWPQAEGGQRAGRPRTCSLGGGRGRAGEQVHLLSRGCSGSCPICISKPDPQRGPGFRVPAPPSPAAWPWESD